eukprot:2592860-Amphidinium_carterae.1
MQGLWSNMPIMAICNASTSMDSTSGSPEEDPLKAPPAGTAFATHITCKTKLQLPSIHCMAFYSSSMFGARTLAFDCSRKPIRLCPLNYSLHLFMPASTVGDAGFGCPPKLLGVDWRAPAT